MCEDGAVLAMDGRPEFDDGKPSLSEVFRKPFRCNSHDAFLDGPKPIRILLP